MKLSLALIVFFVKCCAPIQCKWKHAVEYENEEERERAEEEAFSRLMNGLASSGSNSDSSSAVEDDFSYGFDDYSYYGYEEGYKEEEEGAITFSCASRDSRSDARCTGMMHDTDGTQSGYQTMPGLKPMASEDFLNEIESQSFCLRRYRNAVPPASVVNETAAKEALELAALVKLKKQIPSDQDSDDMPEDKNGNSKRTYVGTGASRRAKDKRSINGIPAAVRVRLAFEDAGVEMPAEAAPEDDGTDSRTAVDAGTQQRWHQWATAMQRGQLSVRSFARRVREDVHDVTDTSQQMVLWSAIEAVLKSQSVDASTDAATSEQRRRQIVGTLGWQKVADAELESRGGGAALGYTFDNTALMDAGLGPDVTMHSTEQETILAERAQRRGRVHGADCELLTCEGCRVAVHRLFFLYQRNENLQVNPLKAHELAASMCSTLPPSEIEARAALGLDGQTDSALWSRICEELLGHTNRADMVHKTLMQLIGTGKGDVAAGAQEAEFSICVAILGACRLDEFSILLMPTSTLGSYRVRDRQTDGPPPSARGVVSRSVSPPPAPAADVLSDPCRLCMSIARRLEARLALRLPVGVLDFHDASSMIESICMLLEVSYATPTDTTDWGSLCQNLFESPTSLSNPSTRVRLAQLAHLTAIHWEGLHARGTANGIREGQRHRERWTTLKLFPESFCETAQLCAFASNSE